MSRRSVTADTLPRRAEEAAILFMVLISITLCRRLMTVALNGARENAPPVVGEVSLSVFIGGDPGFKFKFVRSSVYIVVLLSSAAAMKGISESMLK